MPFSGVMPVQKTSTQLTSLSAVPYFSTAMNPLPIKTGAHYTTDVSVDGPQNVNIELKCIYPKESKVYISSGTIRFPDYEATEKDALAGYITFTYTARIWDFQQQAYVGNELKCSVTIKNKKSSETTT